MSDLQPKVAIIGSGPSGCYTAQFLRKKWPLAEITIFEALPAPYGLLRYGVATDHQGTKAVAAQFDRLFDRESIRFAGNVVIGQDISCENIKKHFDVVVRATGLNHDRELTIDTDDLSSVVGAGALLKAVNSYPHIALPTTQAGQLKSLGRRVAIIGNGNVAMDVARILSKPEQAFEGSDVDDQRLNELKGDGIVSIDIFGRSPICGAKFDLSMLKEVLSLPNVSITVNGIRGVEKDQCKAAEMLMQAQDTSREMVAPVHINFYFCAVPEAYQNRTLTIQHADESYAFNDIDTVITATGFVNNPQAQGIVSPTDDEWEGEHVYKVGWLNRNGKGAIAANRKDAKEVANTIFEQVEAHMIPVSSAGFEALEPDLTDKMITFDDWRKIDAHECGQANEARCRQKVTDIEHMVAIARQPVARQPVARQPVALQAAQ